MKKAVKSKTSMTMDALETFDGTKDPIDHLNTYKNQCDAELFPSP